MRSADAASRETDRPDGVTFTFQVIGMGKKTSEAAEKEQEKFKSKSYKAALDKLPKDQVFISPKLKWVR